MNQQSSPLISVITPSYNQANFIEETILSVKNQSYPNIEHIIMDGGSTDGTLDILRRYEGIYNMRWVSEPDNGQADAVNKGYRAAQGEILGWLNSDDTYAVPHAIEQIVTAWQQHPQGRVFYGDCGKIDENSQLWAIKRLQNYTLKKLLMGASLAQPSFFIHKETLSDIGYLDQKFHFALDWSFTLRLFSQYSPFQLIYIPEVVANSREYGDTKSQTGVNRITQERRRFLTEYFDSHSLPPEVAGLKKRTLGATYWLEAYLQMRYAHNLRAGSTAFGKALVLDPLSFLPQMLTYIWRVGARRFSSGRY